MVDFTEAQKEIKQQISKIKSLFTAPDGEAVFKLLELEFSDRTSFTAGDPHMTAFKEGQRSVILFIKDTLESEYEA